jgi:hypothetical protein
MRQIPQTVLVYLRSERVAARLALSPPTPRRRCTNGYQRDLTWDKTNSQEYRCWEIRCRRLHPLISTCSYRVPHREGERGTYQLKSRPRFAP